MTPKSDHDDDMSMEEILASIRKFVTDNPPEDPQKQRAYKDELAEPVVIPPAGHTGNRGQQEDYSLKPVHPQVHPQVQPSPPIYQPGIADRSSEAPPQSQLLSPSSVQAEMGGHSVQYHQPQSPGSAPSSDIVDRARQSLYPQTPSSPPIYEPDILELTSPIPQKSVNPSPLTEWSNPLVPLKESAKVLEESIMNLTTPLDSKKAESRPNRFSMKPQVSERDESGLGSPHALAASASSLARLAQASKSVPKKTSNLADQRDVTLDQLIQDLIRPMIKQWIDTHLSTLVEEMVAKEIKRITKHLG